jgi:hypothetical protein
MTQKYEIRNWSEYNAGLKQRGSLTFWISEEVIPKHKEEATDDIREKGERG